LPARASVTDPAVNGQAGLRKGIGMSGFRVGDVYIGGGGPLFVIAGPCVIEDEALTLTIAQRLQGICRDLGLPLIFKASYDKANRTSLHAYRGPGLKRGLAVLGAVKARTGLPVLSDVHSGEEAQAAAEVLDGLQIPAFLCRQTDLVLNAARTGLPVNLKKGQFVSPWEMGSALEKAVSTGNRQVMLTERGTLFGYNNLVVDMRAIAVMQQFGFPVIFDATHSVQLPGGGGDRSSGQREFIPTLARAAVGAGADGVFLEVHPDPERAMCDGPNALPLDDVAPLLSLLQKMHALVRGRP